MRPWDYFWHYEWPVELFVRVGDAVVLLVEFLSFMKCRPAGYTHTIECTDAEAFLENVLLLENKCTSNLVALFPQKDA